MLTEDEIKKLLDDLRAKEEEIGQVRSRLNSINREKEDWFSKKSDVGNKIKALIGEVQQAKSKRNELTNSVKELKKVRDEMNTRISANIKVIVESKKDLGEAHTDKQGYRQSPGKLRAEMDELEFKMQTTPMKFEKEQEIMKRIKQLKKELDSMKDVTDAVHKFRTVSKETDHLKRDANEAHRRMQESAAQSQELHEQMISKSKEIDELKKQEKEAYDSFMKHKEEFRLENEKLKTLLDDAKSFREKLEDNKVELATNKAEKQRAILKEKTKEVQEKIQKRKKLTTEDLLIMQRGG